MKMIVVLAALLALAAAAPQTSDVDATVVKYDNVNDGVEGYQYSYETSNGISASEGAKVVNAGSEDAYIQAQGEYSFPSRNGKSVHVTYTADENGYRPKVEIS